MIVVTGGTGFIGSHLKKEVEFKDYSLGNGMDVRDLDQLLPATRGADAIVHLAAETDASLDDIDLVFSHNVLGTVNILEAARRNDVPKVVFASSAAVYGGAKPPLSESSACEPTTPYGASKLAAESYVSAYHSSYGIDASVLRFFNVYGPGCHGVVRDFIESAIEERRITVYGDGTQTRDLVYVEDVVRAIKLFLRRDGFQLLNIATGVPTSINRLAQMVSELAGGVEVEHAEPREVDIRHSHADVSKASDMGFDAKVGLEQGLRRTFRLFRK